jgi:hypothetical protein
MYKHTNCVVPLINYRCKVTSEVFQFLDNLFLKEFMVLERTKGKEDFGIQMEASKLIWTSSSSFQIVPDKTNRVTSYIL